MKRLRDREDAQSDHRFPTSMTPPPDSNRPGKAPLTYKDAGVDIAAGDALVERIKPAVKSTDRPGVMGAIGGFGGLFDLKAAGFAEPVLVAATDGVGTKLKIAIESGRHQTVGIDLVAMCVNDLVVQGAEPLFFLDYYATSRLDPALAADVVTGIATGCREAGCALIGGETAEMPGLYADGDYDLAGFAVGAAERDRLLPRGNIAPGDTLIALLSNGAHSNGFSLIRRVVEREGLKWDTTAPFETSMSLAEALLTPTRIYVQPLLQLLRAGHAIKALAHITGGGLIENVPRVLPEGTGAAFDLSQVPIPSVFSWLKGAGQIADDEMLRTFNCGVGMVIVAPSEARNAIIADLNANGMPAFAAGEIIARPGDGPMVTVEGLQWELP